MELQLSAPIVYCLLEFTEWGGIANLLNCSKGMRFPGIDGILASTYQQSVLQRMQLYRSMYLDARDQGAILSVAVTQLQSESNLYFRARVACVDCGLVLHMSSADEIGSTGRYLCDSCTDTRLLDAVIANWHNTRGLIVAPPLAGIVAVVVRETQLSLVMVSCAQNVAMSIAILSEGLAVVLVG